MSFKPYYEVHITMLGTPAAIRPYVESHGWKFSAIDGDPVLGDGLKCYATTFFNRKLEPEEVIRRRNAVADALVAVGIKVIRRKVELVIDDDRGELAGACNGSCPGCHLDDIAPKVYVMTDEDRHRWMVDWISG